MCIQRVLGPVNTNPVGTVGADDRHKNRRVKQNMGDIVIVTYWQLFDQHERPHADRLFKEQFSAPVDFCDDTYEVGSKMLWQGVSD